MLAVGDPPLLPRLAYQSSGHRRLGRARRRRRDRSYISPSAGPAELLRLTGALRDHDVDLRRCPRWFVASARAPFRFFGSSTKKPLPPGPAPVKTGGFHDAVITCAPNQRVGLHVDHAVIAGAKISAAGSTLNIGFPGTPTG